MEALLLRAPTTAPAPPRAGTALSSPEAGEPRDERRAEFERRLEQANEAGEQHAPTETGPAHGEPAEGEATQLPADASAPALESDPGAHSAGSTAQSADGAPSHSEQRPAARAPRVHAPAWVATQGAAKGLPLPLIAGAVPKAAGEEPLAPAGAPPPARPVTGVQTAAAPLAKLPSASPTAEQNAEPLTRQAASKSEASVAPAAALAREPGAPAPATPALEPGARSEAPARAEPAPAPAPVAETLAPRAAEILRQMRLQLSPQLRQATLQLEPQALGRIELCVRVNAGKASADLRVESEATLAVLQRHVPELRALLESNGLGGGDVSLSWQEPRQEHQLQHGGRDAHAGRAHAQARPAPPAQLAALARIAADASGIDTYA